MNTNGAAKSTTDDDVEREIERRADDPVPQGLDEPTLNGGGEGPWVRAWEYA